MEKSKQTIYLAGIASLLAGIAVSAPVQAFELDAVLSSQAEYSNNARRTNNDKKSDVDQSINLYLAGSEARKNFVASGNLNLSKTVYYNNTYNDKTDYTTGLGLLNFGLIDSFLDWNSSLTRTQTLNDPTSSDTPDNREYRTIFRTGPVVNYKMTEATRMRATSSYVITENSDADVSDSERVNNSLNLTHQYNNVTDFTLGGRYDDIIDADEGEDFTNTNYNAGVTRRFSKGAASFSAGQTRVSPDKGKDTTGEFYNVNVFREDVFWHTLALGYTQDISDTSIGFEDQEIGNAPDDSLPIGVTGTDIIERKRFTAELSRDLTSYAYRFSGYWEDEDYDIQPEDQHSHGIKARFDQNLREGLTVGYTYAFDFNDYEQNDNAGREKRHSFTVDSVYDFAEDLFFDAFVRFRTRDSNGNSDRDYNEFSLGVGVNWVIY